jgi:hypothetical protein
MYVAMASPWVLLQLLELRRRDTVGVGVGGRDEQSSGRAAALIERPRGKTPTRVPLNSENATGRGEAVGLKRGGAPRHTRVPPPAWGSERTDAPDRRPAAVGPALGPRGDSPCVWSHGLLAARTWDVATCQSIRGAVQGFLRTLVKSRARCGGGQGG